jgi:conjugative transfer signal peptidase TraF
MRNIHKERRWRIGLYALLGIAGLTAGSTISMPRLIWNASASVPIGLYFVSAAEFTHGELVLAAPPESVRALAAERKYLPLKVLLAKRIAGISGDKICAAQDAISINDRVVATRQTADSQHRPMPGWTGCRVLTDEVFLLLGDVPTSFDGRYFGPVPRSAIAGKLTPLWTR